MTANYAASSDVFVVMIKTPQYGCTAYDTLVRVDTLASEIRQLPGVESTKFSGGVEQIRGSGNERRQSKMVRAGSNTKHAERGHLSCAP